MSLSKATTAIVHAVRLQEVHGGGPAGRRPVEGLVAGVAIEALGSILHPAKNGVLVLTPDALELAHAYFFVIVVRVVIENDLFSRSLEVHLCEECRDGPSCGFMDRAGIENTSAMRLTHYLWHQEGLVLAWLCYW